MRFSPVCLRVRVREYLYVYYIKLVLYIEIITLLQNGYKYKIIKEIGCNKWL